METKSNLLIREYHESRLKLAIIEKKIKHVDKKLSILRENNEAIITK